MLSDHEKAMMGEIELRVSRLSDFLNSHVLPPLETSASWYEFLSAIKSIQGNSSNDVSFVATLLAKQYLVTQYGLKNYDAAEKPQGAPGLDIDVQLPDGKRLVAEIKTTSPYKPNDLGAQQKAMFQKDFSKLAASSADIKLFLLTEQITFDLMKLPKYRSQLSGVSVVLLTTGETFSA